MFASAYGNKQLTGSEAQLVRTQTERKNVGRKVRRGNCRISMLDYKFLRVAVMICANLVNTQTVSHTLTDRQLLTGYTISSAS